MVNGRHYQAGINMKTRKQTHQGYLEIIKQAEKDNEVQAAKRTLCQHDLFFLLVYVLHRQDIDRDWLFDRCREVQHDPNGYLDLWARDHYKSSIITYGLTIQDILNNPEITVGIFSFIRPIAKSFMRQIKTDFESNEELKELFPDIFWSNPRKEAPKWSEDDGIVCKRKSNPKEATIEAWGLVDGMPTGRHYKLRVYDDIITEKSVTTPEMINKVTTAWELSQNLGQEGGEQRIIGTRYHFADTYHVMMERGSVIPREYPATKDGKAKGEPVLISQDSLNKKRRDQGPYVFSCHGADTLITMGDWSHRKIKDIVVGDIVVGYTHIKGSKAILTPTLVEAINFRTAPAVQSTMSNGDILIHTSDHQWWTGRAPWRDRRTYCTLGLKPTSGVQKGLCHIVDLPKTEGMAEKEYRAAGYLAAIIDGEGSAIYRTLQIHQDWVIHPEICKQIEWCLQILRVKFSIFDLIRGKKHGRTYTILGGRGARIRLLALLGNRFGKKKEVVSQCYGARNFGKGRRINLVAQKDIGEVEVYNIQTQTGNYIAGGYASKNCQMLLDPVAEEMQELKPKWLQYWPAIHYTNMNLYLFCDPAGEKKKTNDYTVFTVWGLGPDNNYYVIEWIRDRMNLTERANVLFALQRRYNPDRVIYEKYGMQSDIEHYQDRMNRENYRFRIEEIGGQVNKEDRIRKLIPLFEQGRVYIPETCVRVNLQGKAEDLTQIFIKEEYMLFPFSVHDDMLDNMARIVDIRTDRPDLIDDFMGLDFKSLKDRNVLAMKDFEHRQQTNEYSILTDGMR